MMDDHTTPLPPELRSLLDRERSDAPYADAQARLARRLAFAEIADVAVRPKTPPWGTGLLKAVALVGAGAVGGVSYHAYRDRSAPPRTVTVERVVIREVPAPPAVAVVAPPVVAPPARHDSSSSLGEEQHLLDTARTAVERSAFTSALATLDACEARFRHGQLVEEREVLRIQALAGAGRLDDAKARATRFEARFSSSIFLPVVREALAAGAR